jgi:dTDP-4-dehydrorhamnose 3,5-epimerase
MPSKFRYTPINGVIELTGNPFVDIRGFFLNAFRSNEEAFMNSWGDRGINQVNISHSETIGTIRGLHLQADPHSEAKMVRCLRGCVWDVAVDLRRDSATYGHWHAVKLSPEQGNALVIPEGCAHGFQVLKARSDLLYLHSGAWVPEAETGVRWDDPSLAIPWPLSAKVISDRDQSLPLLPSGKRANTSMTDF